MCVYYFCSAVDQFRKQFAHLEESCGKSGPVIPLERKHASLPRYIYLNVYFLASVSNLNYQKKRKETLYLVYVQDTQ